MARKKLRSTVHNLAHAYQSTLFYFAKGYMADWACNVAQKKGLSILEVDIIKGQVFPIDAHVEALIAYTDKLRQSLEHDLESIGLKMDFVKKATLKLSIVDEKKRLIKIVAEITDIEDCTYQSKDFLETSECQFDPFENNKKVLRRDAI